MESTWEPQDLPVLDAVVRYFDEEPAQPGPRVADIAKDTGFEVEDAYRALKALHPTYVQLQGALGKGLGGSLVRGITDEARQAIGQWPTAETFVDRLADALLKAAEQEPDPVKKSRLRSTAEALGGAVREVAIQAAGSFLGTTAGKPFGM
jgi:hypothetical protein